MKLRKKITLACEKCFSRNYKVTKKCVSIQKFNLNKYCPKCQKVTVHKETR